jgi:hypothetical protein
VPLPFSPPTPGAVGIEIGWPLPLPAAVFDSGALRLRPPNLGRPTRSDGLREDLVPRRLEREGVGARRTLSPALGAPDSLDAPLARPFCREDEPDGCSVFRGAIRWRKVGKRLGKTGREVRFTPSNNNPGTTK